MNIRQIYTMRNIELLKGLIPSIPKNLFKVKADRKNYQRSLIVKNKLKKKKMKFLKKILSNQNP